MQTSSIPTAYGGGEAHRLLAMLLRPQAGPAGQDLPGTTTDATAATTLPDPASGAARFVSRTLGSLLSAQEAPPASPGIAAKIIGAADTNGDGALSLSEIQSALAPQNAGGALSADALSKAFASIDTDGDGQISASELSTALDAQKGAHGAHQHHHAHAAQANSSDVASQLIGAADADGDGALSVAEVERALGSSAGSDALSSALGKLDTNGDGALSATELTAAIDAFRAAHHRGASEVATSSPSTQAVTA